MSLIINMLKDLENRDSKSDTLEGLSLTNTYKKYRLNSFITNNLKLIIAIALSSIATIAIFSITYLVYYNRSHYYHIVNPLPVTGISAADIANQPMNLKKVAVNGVTIQPSENTILMHLNMSQPFLYRLGSNSKDHLYVTIDNSELKSQLPEINTPDLLLTSLHAKKIDDKVQFDIGLKSGWLVKSIETTEHNGRYGLKLSIEATPNTKNSKISESNAIKKPVGGDELGQRYRDALNYAHNGNKSKAISLLATILNDAADFHQVRTSYIALLIENGKFDVAEKSLRQGILMQPGYIPYIELKARLLTIKNDISGAISLLQESAPDITDYPDYYAFLAALYERSNKDIMAANIYRQLIDIDPKNGNWWFGLGLSLDKSGNPKDAIYAYSRASSKGSLNSTSLAYLHRRLQTLQDEGGSNAG